MPDQAGFFWSQVMSYRICVVLFCVVFSQNLWAIDQIHLKTNKYYKADLGTYGELVCVDEDNLDNSTKASLAANYEVISLSHTTGLKTELACYKCCVAESGYTMEGCQKFSNYKKGKDCNCTGK